MRKSMWQSFILLLAFALPHTGNASELIEINCSDFGRENSATIFLLSPENKKQALRPYGVYQVRWESEFMHATKDQDRVRFDYRTGKASGFINSKYIWADCKFKNLSLLEKKEEKGKIRQEEAKPEAEKQEEAKPKEEKQEETRKPDIWEDVNFALDTACKIKRIQENQEFSQEKRGELLMQLMPVIIKTAEAKKRIEAYKEQLSETQVEEFEQKGRSLIAKVMAGCN